MKHFTVLLLVGALLGGCSRKEPVDESFNHLDQEVQHLGQTLPAECKTESVMAAIEKVQAGVTEARAKCEMKISEYKTKYERLTTIVFLVILGFFVKFFIKK